MTVSEGVKRILKIFFNGRDMLTYIYIPVIQKQLDIFRTTIWNHKPGREQKDKALPTGVPDLLYKNPEEYNGFECGSTFSDEILITIAAETSVLEGDSDYISEEQRNQFETVIPDTSIIEAKDAAKAYIYLKHEITIEDN